MKRGEAKTPKIVQPGAGDAVGVGVGVGVVVPDRFSGLGNQLFQIAAAFVVATETGKTLCIHKSFTGNHHATQDYCVTIFRHLVTISPGAVKHAVPFVHSGCFEPWNSADAGATAGATAPNASIKIKGYFQYYPPLGGHEAALRRLFLTGIADIDTTSIPESCVGIHVRRGDYLLTSTHYILAPTYYEDAMSRFPAETAFVVFSDDLAWCRSQAVFSASPHITFVDEPNEVRSLAKMTAARGGFICANSTFSWWAAFLGAYGVRAPVIVPASRWVAATIHDLFPPEWTKL